MHANLNFAKHCQTNVADPCRDQKERKKNIATTISLKQLLYKLITINRNEKKKKV